MDIHPIVLSALVHNFLIRTIILLRLSLRLSSIKCMHCTHIAAAILDIHIQTRQTLTTRVHIPVRHQGISFLSRLCLHPLRYILTLTNITLLYPCHL